MGNANLKNALQHAGLTSEQLAQVIQVDPKSVQRWVTGNTIPYPRHRAAISQALNLTEHDLWPNETTSPIPDETKDGNEPQGVGGDVSGAWAYTDDPAAPDLAAFITDTTGPVDVLDSCCGTQLSVEVTDALREQADAGRQVRILTDGSAPHWEALLGHEQIEIYFSEIPGEYWLIKTPDTMLVTINLEHEPGSNTPPPPILQLTPVSAGGVFDRLAGKFEELWEHTRETDPGEDTGPPPGPPAAGPAADASGEPRRRWPRQPDRPPS